MIDIQGLDKADVLASLYNASKPMGMGRLHFDPTPMTREEAAALLSDSIDKYFDYIKGRIMKVSLKCGFIDERLYDRDNGPGAAEFVILELLTRPGAP